MSGDLYWRIHYRRTVRRHKPLPSAKSNTAASTRRWSTYRSRNA